MGHATRAAGKIGALLAVCWLSVASAAGAQCADPMQLGVEYGAVSFTQTRHLTGVRAPLISRGSAVVSAAGVDWRVTDPIEVRTTITASGITQSVEGGPAQPVAAGGDGFFSSAGLLSLLAGDIAALRNYYEVARAAPGAGGAWRLRLTPKTANIARFLSYIEVGGCQRVSDVQVRQANGDWMQIALSPGP